MSIRDFFRSIGKQTAVRNRDFADRAQENEVPLPHPSIYAYTVGRSGKTVWQEGFRLPLYEGITLYFVNEEKGIEKKIVEDRKFCHFPGYYEKDYDTIRRYVNLNRMRPVLCYDSALEHDQEGFYLLWTVQPDGQYWADEDGFGAESDPEVLLYTRLTEDGEFDGPFRIYKIT